jgi:chemotaxis protein MotB
MAVEEEDAGGIPEWVVTFGDMMSLLLTFFIMLVSMSEIKQEEQFQALVESMRRQFGHDTSLLSLAPGSSRPRNSNLPNLASLGRAKRVDTMSGGDKVRAPSGENRRVRTVRPGQNVTIGGVIYFDEGSAKLTDDSKIQLQIIAQQISGKPQKVEVRGHTTRRPVGTDSPYYKDNWDLAYARCRSVVEFLVNEQGIDRTRIRMSVAGENEPVYVGTDSESIRQNGRVEVSLLDERVEDLEGNPHDASIK